MNRTQLIEFVKSLDESLAVAEGKEFVEVTLPPEKLHSTALALRDNEKTRFDFLFCLSGVDYKTDLGVVYHLRSTELGHSIVLKTRTSDRVNPVIDTVSDIWKTAEFHEREVFDLFGIKFADH